MIIIHERHSLTITRGTFPKIRGGTWGTAEAAFWKRLRDTLNETEDTGAREGRWTRREAQRARWRRVNPQRHGHMTGSRYMLLDQGNRRCIHDVDSYAVRDPAEVYNQGGRVRLAYLPDYEREG